MLDAFIGLVFVYLTLSLFVTAIAEAIVQMRNLRGRNLVLAVARMLKANIATVIEVFNDPRIEALKPDEKPMLLQRFGFRLPFPSYIPGEIFTDALLNSLYVRDIKLEKPKPIEKEDSRCDFKCNLIALIIVSFLLFLLFLNHNVYFVYSALFFIAIIVLYVWFVLAREFIPERNNYNKETTLPETAATLAELLASPARLEQKIFEKTNSIDTNNDSYSGHIYLKMKDFWLESDQDVSRFKSLIEQWHTNVFDRAKGSYKRGLTTWLFSIGLVIAVSMNVDTIEIYKTLTDNPQLRNVLLEKAIDSAGIAEEDRDMAAFEKEICEKIKELKTQTQNSDKTKKDTEHTSETTEEGNKGDAETGEQQQSDDQSEQGCTTLDVAKYQATHIMPLVGWYEKHPLLIELKKIAETTNKKTSDSDPQNNLSKINLANLVPLLILSSIGWFLTAMALSLGAPFWFDMLQKLVSIRGSIKPVSPKAKEENEPPENKPVIDTRTGKPIAVVSDPGQHAVADTIDTESFSSFEHKKVGYSLLNAWWMARFARLSYANLALVSSTLSSWGINGQLYDAKKKGTQFIFAHDDSACVIAFRGTEPTKIEDVLTDLDARSNQDIDWADDENIALHKGFSEALDVAWSILIKEMQESKIFDKQLPIWISGHSLGGALSLICAARLANYLKANKHANTIAGLYTFGQPRVGNDAFVRLLENRLPNRYVRFVNNRDVVPLVPPPGIEKFPYSHGGRIAYFNDFGQMVLDAAQWYQAMDKIALASDAEEFKDKGSELVGDHDMSFYLNLISHQLSIKVV